MLHRNVDMVRLEAFRKVVEKSGESKVF